MAGGTQNVSKFEVDGHVARYHAQSSGGDEFA